MCVQKFNYVIQLFVVYMIQLFVVQTQRLLVLICIPCTHHTSKHIYTNVHICILREAIQRATIASLCCSHGISTIPFSVTKLP